MTAHDPDGYTHDARGRRLHLRRYAEAIARSGRDRHDGHRGSTPTATATWSRPTAATWRCRSVVIATGACNLPPCPARVAEAAAAGHRDRSRRMAVPQPRPARRRRRAGGRRVGDRHPARRGDPSLGPPGDARGRRARPRAADLSRPRHPVVDGHRPACSTSATTRSTTSRGRGAFPRRSSSARRSEDARPQHAERASASKLAASSPGSATARRSSRARCANCCALADLKMNRLLDTIDAFAAASGLDAEVEPPHRFPPTEVDESPPLGLDLDARRDQDDPLGDGLPARLFLARPAGA